MKITSFLIMITFSLCASLCGCPTEEIYEQINILNNNIIKIENNQNTFKLGDKLNLTISIDNQQVTTNNKTILLSDYISTTNSEKATIYNYFILYKKTDFNTFAKIPITNDVIEVLNGTVTTSNEYIQVKSFLKDDKFVSEFRISLLESGTFYLSGNNFYDPDINGKTYFNVNSTPNTNISLLSNIINSDEKNLYKFTVN